MRTTLNLDEDVLRAARARADLDGRSLGEVISELVRQALRPDRGIAEKDGFPVFEVSPDSPIMTPELVQEALDEL